MDRDRLRRVAEETPGRGLATTTPERLVAFLAQNPTAQTVVVDLDGGGTEALAALATAAEQDLLPGRVLGYFSHVQEQTGKAAREAGVEAYPRGRFWRDLDSLIQGNQAD